VTRFPASLIDLAGRIEVRFDALKADERAGQKMDGGNVNRGKLAIGIAKGRVGRQRVEQLGGPLANLIGADAGVAAMSAAMLITDRGGPSVRLKVRELALALRGVVTKRHA
jgi:hypothetical protein